MSDTGWKITLDGWPDWPRGRTIVWSRIASLPVAVESALREHDIGDDFSGSLQITVESCQLEPAGSASEPDDQRPQCPDGGACHHECGDGPCFRVLTCEPLSDTGWGAKWPAEIALIHRNREATRKLPDESCARDGGVCDCGAEVCEKRLRKSVTAPAVRPSR